MTEQNQLKKSIISISSFYKNLHPVAKGYLPIVPLIKHQ
jgi:hypothetical protein